MVFRLINKPPVFVDMPKFIFKRFAKGFVYRIVAWSQKEYYDCIGELYSTGNRELVKYMEDNCTYIDFLAHSTAFRKLSSNIDADIWKTLDRKTQDILIEARRILASEGKSR